MKPDIVPFWARCGLIYDMRFPNFYFFFLYISIPVDDSISWYTRVFQINLETETKWNLFKMSMQAYGKRES